MPAPGTNDNRCVSVGFERLGKLLENFFERLLFDRLTIPILPIQAARQQEGFLSIIRQQQIEGVLGHPNPSRRIETGPKTKTHVGRPDWQGDASHFYQSPQSRPLRLLQLPQSVVHESPILIHQWNQVGNGTQSNQVEALFEIKIWEAPCAQQSVAELENKTGCTKI